MAAPCSTTLATSVIDRPPRLEHDTSPAAPATPAPELRRGLRLPRRVCIVHQAADKAETSFIRVSEFLGPALYGVVGPADIPAPAVAALSRAVLDLLAQPEVIRRLAASGVDVNAAGPEGFRKLIEAEIPKWPAVVKAAGMRTD
jgi:hypothetical protein